jgi:hypothetical protein
MNVKEIELDSFEAFIQNVGQYYKYIEIRLYRGQKDDLPLHSKLFRLLQEKNRLEQFYWIEEKILNNFKNLSIIYSNNIDYENPWDLLSFSQHFGLPTRLLDWSSNPLIALWFAFSEEKDNNKSRVVWGLNVQDGNIVNTKKDDPFNQRFIRAFKPKNIDPRIIAQHSWFTIQNPNIVKPADGLPKINSPEAINENEEFEYDLVKFIFPNNLKFEILKKLDIIGINYSTIFPDLGGICKYIEWKELK